MRGSDTLVEAEKSTSAAEVGLVRAMPPNLAGKASRSRTSSLMMNLPLQEAHSHQFRHTFHYGAALRFDGFALLFNILCERQESRVRERGEGKRERRERGGEGREGKWGRGGEG